MNGGINIVNMRKLIMKTTRPSFKYFKAKALKNPEVKVEYDLLKPIFELKQHKATQEVSSCDHKLFTLENKYRKIQFISGTK